MCVSECAVPLLFFLSEEKGGNIQLCGSVERRTLSYNVDVSRERERESFFEICEEQVGFESSLFVWRICVLI